MKKEADVYSSGVVLLEIIELYNANNEKGLPSMVIRRFIEETLKEMVDPEIKEADENIFVLTRGLDQDSLDAFSKIAYQCLAETQAKRPREVAIKELEKALNIEDNLQISLEDIKLATQNFSHIKG